MSLDTTFRRLRDANPVPRPASLTEKPLISADFLDATKQRSHQMQTREHPNAEESHKAPKPWKVPAMVTAGLIVVIGLFSGVSSNINPFSAGDDPVGTIKTYIDRYNAEDIEGIMELFTEESVVIGHPLAAESRGLEEIRAVQTEDVRLGVTYTTSNVQVEGNTVTWDSAWGGQFCTEGHSAVIKDGTILAWTWPETRFSCPQSSE